MTDDLNMREMGVEGFLFLRMKAKDTEFNERIFESFKECARVECKNDYTLMLGKLLEYYQQDAKTQLLWNAIDDLSRRVSLLEDKSKEVREIRKAPEDVMRF